MKKILWSLIMVGLVYVFSYVVFRQSHIRYWPEDKKFYVIFPVKLPYLYYLWRPMCHIDGAITDMRCHLGAHR